jgi:exosome complex component RRP41
MHLISLWFNYAFKNAAKFILCIGFAPNKSPPFSLQILQADGGNYSACINAATLALIDAGIPMKDYVCSCAVSFINDSTLLDTNYLEESSSAPQLTLAILPKSEKIVLFRLDSKLHADNLEKVLNLAKQGCKDVYTLLRKHVHDFTKDSLASMCS